MKNLVLSLLVVACVAAVPIGAQNPTPVPAPSPPPSPSPAPDASPAPVVAAAQLANIRIDVTVREQGGAAAPSRKTVSLTLADRQGGSVRSTGAPPDPPSSPPPRMNVDAFPMIQSDGRVQTQVTLDYGIPGRGTSIRVEPLLESGKPLIASEASDPGSERRIVVELTATVLQ